ncbi:MAG: Gfo/Idh/MocA family oxidoreductase [Pseudomonadota bacterium]
MTTGIAYLGCGFVADFYQSCLPNASGALDVRGVFDIDQARLDQFAAYHDLPKYGSLDQLLADDSVDIVVNLTNPHAHYEVSKACLEAGKHVYSEKPLAMDLDEARDLVSIAEARGLEIAGAPSSVLGGAAQTLWRAVRDGVAGAPRLVYAEIDDGMVHRIGCENWKSLSGAPWPAIDEFDTGCTMEHAGYALAWLVAMFGPVRRVVSFSALIAPDKGAFTPPDYTTPDMSIGCLEFADGVVARLTNSVIAPHDHAMRVFCDEGELRVDEIWDFNAPVKFRPVLDSRLARLIQKKTGWRKVVTIPPVRRERLKTAPNGARMDFTRGVVEMAEALAEGRRPRLAGAFTLHVTEVSLALQHPEVFGAEYIVTTDVPAMTPLG